MKRFIKTPVIGLAYGCLAAMTATGVETKTEFDHVVIATEDAFIESARPDATATHGTFNYANYPEGSTNATSGARRIWLKYRLPEFSGTPVRTFFLVDGGHNGADYFISLYRASNFLADGVTSWRDENPASPDNITWNRQGDIGGLVGIHNQAAKRPPNYNVNGFWNVRSGELAEYIGGNAGRDISFAVKVFHKDHMDGSANAFNGGINFYTTEWCGTQERADMAPRLVFDIARPGEGFDFVAYPADDAFIQASQPDRTEWDGNELLKNGYVYINEHEWRTNNVGTRVTRRQWLKFRLPHKNGTVKNAVFTYRRSERDDEAGNSRNPGYITVAKASNFLADGTTPWHDEDFGYDERTTMNITWNRQGWIGEPLFNSWDNWADASQVYTNAAKPYIEFSSPELDAYLNEAGPGGCVSFALQNWRQGFDDERAEWTAQQGGNWIFTHPNKAMCDGDYYQLPTLHYKCMKADTILILR